MTASKTQREEFVTEMVKDWITNDRVILEQAKELLIDPRVLVSWVELLLKTASRLKESTYAAWQVRQELAPNDFQRIAWSEVVDAIRAVEL
ncbi:Hypothetical protein AJAP_27985 [Amycolatopsis japonica]|uniref:Uncharacterized protein n=1 Tax=Amycolatopsis japonica TaxID=208439 RepID=A0A075V190_9PSEU|nr:hypothetical protein [Amycolatopsis japonica]AIG78436.1 Hypothetical protein AJAP_27985 [Amycolatopsis japonica]